MVSESTVQGVSVCVSVSGYTHVCVGMYVSVVSLNTSVCACVCVKEWGGNVTFVYLRYCLLRRAGSPVLGQGTCRSLSLHRQLRLAKTMNRAESLQEKR